MFICIVVVAVLFGIAVASIFIVGSSDVVKTTESQNEAIEEEEVTIYESQEKSFEQDGQVMAALKEE